MVKNNSLVKVINFIFILMLFLPIREGEASSCKRVNLLYKKWGMFKRQMPLYDQGENGICYAYAASQMTDYWREVNGLQLKGMKMGQSTPVFAAILARLYKSIDKRETLDAGDPKTALLAIKDFGMCDERTVQRSIDNFANKKGLSPEKFLDGIERFFSLHRKDNKGGLMTSFFTPFEKLRKKYFWTDVDFSRVEKVMKPYLEKNDFAGLMVKIFSKCFKKENIYLNSLRLPDLEESFLRDGLERRFISKINGLLLRPKATPIGISYCANLLQNKKYDGRSNNRMRSDCHGHASILVGQRERGGRCEFLLRNTWGSECMYDWECQKDSLKNGKTVGVWIDSKKLMENTHSFIYFKDDEVIKKVQKKKKRREESRIKSYFKEKFRSFLN